MNSRATAENNTDKESEIKKLQDIVESMDHLSQNGFSEIAAIAQLAKERIERLDYYSDLEDVAIALGSIRGRALDIQNCINCEAESVGCHYIPEDRERLWVERKVREALQE